jgi:hypothetical protein
MFISVFVLHHLHLNERSQRQHHALGIARHVPDHAQVLDTIRRIAIDGVGSVIVDTGKSPLLAVDSIILGLLVADGMQELVAEVIGPGWSRTLG